MPHGFARATLVIQFGDSGCGFINSCDPKHALERPDSTKPRGLVPAEMDGLAVVPALMPEKRNSCKCRCLFQKAAPAGIGGPARRSYLIVPIAKM